MEWLCLVSETGGGFPREGDGGGGLHCRVHWREDGCPHQENKGGEGGRDDQDGGHWGAQWGGVLPLLPPQPPALPHQLQHAHAGLLRVNVPQPNTFFLEWV